MKVTTLTNRYHETDSYEIDQHAAQILSKQHNQVFNLDPRVIEVIIDQFEFGRNYASSTIGQDLLFNALCEVATIAQIKETA